MKVPNAEGKFLRNQPTHKNSGERSLNQNHSKHKYTNLTWKPEVGKPYRERRILLYQWWLHVYQWWLHVGFSSVLGFWIPIVILFLVGGIPYLYRLCQIDKVRESCSFEYLKFLSWWRLSWIS